MSNLHIDVNSDCGAKLRFPMVGARNDKHVVLRLLIIKTGGEGEDAGRRVEREHLVAPLCEQAVCDVGILVLVSISGSDLTHLELLI